MNKIETIYQRNGRKKYFFNSDVTKLYNYDIEYHKSSDYKNIDDCLKNIADKLFLEETTLLTFTDTNKINFY